MSSPRVCVVTGSFSDRYSTPVQGLVRFTPARLWVVKDGITWACLAPTLVLEHGRFVAFLTATDNDSIRFTYLVETPAGAYETQVPYTDREYNLPELLRAHGAKIAS